MPRIKPGPPCSVCGQPSHARNLCSVHHSRWLRHGHTEQTRPEGWGKRSSHSLKDTWCNTLKCVEGRDGRWNDFWAFVEDVGDRPHPDARLKRRNPREPWSVENCFWTEPLGLSPVQKAD